MRLVCFQVGGGDQIYCDHVMELPALKPWLSVDDPHGRAKEPFTPQLLKEMEQFYFGACLQLCCYPHPLSAATQHALHKPAQCIAFLSHPATNRVKVAKHSAWCVCW